MERRRENFGMMSPVTGRGGCRSHQQRGISTLLLVFRLGSEEEMALATTLEIVMSKEGERGTDKNVVVKLLNG
jgi:hypothetical protein